MNPITCNFGPIARTDAGGKKDTINLAALPLHVLLVALTASTSAEEFVAWLWHDLYKPTFQWVLNKKGELSWYHTPGRGAFDKVHGQFATDIDKTIGLVSSHHDKPPQFKVPEKFIMSDQGDQVNLGKEVNYIQLSIATEPALATSLVCAAIADAFIEVVTRDVAASLQKKLQQHGTPIECVRFVFKSLQGLTPPQTPNDSYIWNNVGKHFDVRFEDTTFVMEHYTPLNNVPANQFDTTLTIDLTGDPLTPNELINNTLSLAELLVLYQDSRSIIIALPQKQLYPLEQSKLDKLLRQTIDATRKRLDDFDVLTVRDGTDYLQIAFDTQVEIRKVPVVTVNQKRPLEEVVLRPSERIAQARKSATGRICRITGTAFESQNHPSSTNLSDLFSGSFVDTEFVGSSGDVSPLAQFYIINSPNSEGAGKKGVSKRTSMRGSFLLLAPATHVVLDEGKAQAIERPVLDKGGRFANTLNRITVTTQEFTLFQQMSRRIIAQLWHSIDSNKPLSFPYLGAIALTHKQADSIKKILPKLKTLFSDVRLHVYPFDIRVRPAVEVVIETAIADSKHAGKHTLLKTTPRIITVEPRSAIPLLVDDKVQFNITAKLFEHVDMLQGFTQSLRHHRNKVKQSDVWIKLLLNDNDLVTAVFESAQATLNTRTIPNGSSIENEAFSSAERFWNQHIGVEDPAQSWNAYEQQRNQTSTTLEQFPAIMLLIRALQESQQKEEKERDTTTQ
jgi:hypothetical protein